jgi:hypothetical protein
MAQPPRAANGDGFVRHIVQDPKNVPDVMLLYGYPGASSEEGHERLYLSPDLSAYVEVPNGSILHRAEAAKEQDPHGGVTLWVKKDAALKYRMAPAQEAAQKAMAWYFAGALQGGGGQAGPQAALPQTLPYALCPPGTLPDGCPVSVAHPACLTRHATCGVTCVATCHATCPPRATCGATCVATCHATCAQTCVATCAATCAATCPPQATCGETCVATCHATCHYTCAPICTHVTPCRPTFNQPECPYPTEICTHAAAQCTHVVNCPLPQAQAAMGGAAPQAAMAAGAQVACALGTIHQSLQVVCSLATCAIECEVTRRLNTCNPECWITRYWTCNIECRLTHIPELCRVAGPGGGPVEQAQLCLAGSVRPPQVTVACTIGGGCQSLPCPSWQYTCGWCPPRTPACPW